MATETVPGAAPSNWRSTWEAIDTCMLQAAGIVDLMNVSGNPNQNAAWAVQDLLDRAHELHAVLMNQLRDATREATHG